MQTGPKVVPVTVAKAERRTVETTVDVVGTLKGWEDVKVGAEKSGRVVKVLHDVGDRVKPGEPLVELEAINADLAVRQAEQRLISELAKLGLHELPQGDFNIAQLPAVRQAQAAADRAEQKFAREQRLAEKRVNTVESYQDAEFELRDKQAALDNAILSARATLASAMASRVDLDVARQAREDLIVRAPEPTRLPAGLNEPIEYAVTKRMVSEGQMIREGEEVLHLVIDKPLRMWVNVPEKYTPYATVGQEVRLTVASHPGRIFNGTVTWINPSVDPDSRTFQVEVSIPNEDRACARRLRQSVGNYQARRSSARWCRSRQSFVSRASRSCSSSTTAKRMTYPSRQAPKGPAGSRCRARSPPTPPWWSVAKRNWLTAPR